MGPQRRRRGPYRHPLLSAPLIHLNDPYPPRPSLAIQLIHPQGWTRLIPCLPPNPLIDYRSFLERRWNAMTAADFIAMVSSSTVLGDSTLSTGSFLGGTSWRRVSDTEIIGYHQPRLLHQRYADASRKEMRDEGRAHSMNNHRFRKVEGVWIFAGLAPDFRAGDGNRVKCMMDVFRELLEGNRRRRSEDRTSERDVRCYAACGRRRTAGQGGINGSVAGSSPVRA